MANDAETLRNTLDLFVSKDHSPGSQEKVATEITNSISSPPPIGKLPPDH